MTHIDPITETDHQAAAAVGDHVRDEILKEHSHLVGVAVLAKRAAFEATETMLRRRYGRATCGWTCGGSCGSTSCGCRGLRWSCGRCGRGWGWRHEGHEHL